MKKAIAIATVVGALLLVPTTAWASGVQDRVAAELENSNTYDAPSDVAEAYEGSDVGVIYLSLDEIDDLPQSQNRTQLADSMSPYDTTIMVIDGSMVTVAGDAKAEVADIIGLNGGAEAILASAQEIVAVTETSTSVATTPVVTANSNVSFGGVIVIVAVVFIFGAAAIFVMRSKSLRKNVLSAKITTTQQNLVGVVDDENLKNILKEYQLITDEHRALGTDLAPALETLSKHTGEFFKRLTKTKNQSKINMATLEYSKVFKNINTALGKDYYLDILANDNLWSDAEARLLEVTEVVSELDGQIVDNVRQLNASKDLEFRVTFESLKNSIHNDPGQMLTSN